jgi:small nuclear ribonucleoprotein (snRNP)-like protein
MNVSIGLPRFPRACLCALLCLALLLDSRAEAQEDTITMRNGDRLSGEIKSLDRGMIRFDTDATDTIPIKWEHVEDLTSAQSFLVTLSNGRRVFGSIQGVDAGKMVTLSTLGGGLEVRLADIVRMAPIEGRVVEQIDMGVDVGYSIAKANDVVQTTLGFDFAYRTEQNQFQLNSDFARSSSEPRRDARSDSQRTNLTGLYRRFIPGHSWLPYGLAQIERNDELGLRRRETLGGGMSRYLTDTNAHQITFTGGIVASTEDPTDALDSNTSLESMVGLNIQWFRYDSPALDVSSQLLVFERLSGDSRTRGNLDLTFRWELIKDFNWGMSVYYSFDTAPENADASGADYGVVTTLGWSF